MKKLLTLILACAMITGLFAAGVAAEDKIKVGYDIYFLGNSWSVQLYQEFKWNIENNYADKIDVTYVESEGDISKQIANLEDLDRAGSGRDHHHAERHDRAERDASGRDGRRHQGHSPVRGHRRRPV